MFSLIQISEYFISTTILTRCYNLLYILNEDNEKENKEKNFTREPIKIYINSYGGKVDDMWSLIDIMLGSKTPIYTYSTSYAYSAGFLIFIAGKKRFITKHTSLCCHQIFCTTIGVYQDIKEQSIVYDRTWSDIEKYILDQTNITQDRIREVRERKLDWYIYSEDAINLGVATDIVESF